MTFSRTNAPPPKPSERSNAAGRRTRTARIRHLAKSANPRLNPKLPQALCAGKMKGPLALAVAVLSLLSLVRGQGAVKMPRGDDPEPDTRVVTYIPRECSRPKCPDGRCHYKDCRNAPSCKGGMCKFTGCNEPSCDGGVCVFEGCHEPHCKGGGCQFFDTRTTLGDGFCIGGACTIEGVEAASNMADQLVM